MTNYVCMYVKIIIYILQSLFRMVFFETIFFAKQSVTLHFWHRPLDRLSQLLWHILGGLSENVD